MSEEAAELHIAKVCRAFGGALQGLLRGALRDLWACGAARLDALEHMESKFSLDGACVGRFAALDDFYRGPEARIGAPYNVNITTSPIIEWEFIVRPNEQPASKFYPQSSVHAA
jgi:hypothetical protein